MSNDIEDKEPLTLIDLLKSEVKLKVWNLIVLSAFIIIVGVLLS